MRIKPDSLFYLLAVVGCVLLVSNCAVSRIDTVDPASTTQARDTFRVVGYAPDYSFERIDPVTYTRITDVILFSAVLTNDGYFPEAAIAALPVEHFQEVKREHQVRIHLCFGGWGRSNGFAEMTGDAMKRNAFIETLLQWCLTNDFDGVDYDWEFPADSQEHAAYSQLIVETAEAFHPHGLWITVALGHTQALEQAAYDAVDSIHLMTYDMGYRHSTEEDAEAAVKRLIETGAPRDKIVLGVPFYGRRMDDRNVTMAYRNILSQYSPSPDEDEAGGFYFNHIDTIRRKTQFALEEGLAGLMIWELSMDTADERSLLRSIEMEIEGD